MLPDHFEEIRGVISSQAFRPKPDFLRLSPDGLNRGDHLFFEHPVQHVNLPLPRFLGIPEGGQTVRRRREAGHHGAFGQGQVFHRFAEINLGRSARSIGPFPQVNLVQIQEEDLVLGEIALDPLRQDGFLDFSGVAPFGGEEEGFGDLLGDRAPPLNHFEGFDIAESGSQNPPVVDSPVLEEPGVLGRHEGVDQHPGHFRQRNNGAPFDEEFPDENVILGINFGDEVGIVIF